MNVNCDLKRFFVVVARGREVLFGLVDVGDVVIERCKIIRATIVVHLYLAEHLLAVEVILECFVILFESIGNRTEVYKQSENTDGVMRAFIQLHRIEIMYRRGFIVAHQKENTALPAFRFLFQRDLATFACDCSCLFRILRCLYIVMPVYNDY